VRSPREKVQDGESQMKFSNMDRGKRRSASQRIGKEGEKIFELWATKRSLTTNKTEEDIGIDFFCQVLKSVGTKRSEESTGQVLGVQVRTVEDDSLPKVILDRIDATDLLRQAQATCIVGVHLKDGSVRFRFLDRKEIDRLLAFLASDAETTSIPFSEMDLDDSTFRRMLRRFTDPGAQLGLRIHLVQARLTRRIPGAKVSISQDDSEGIVVVKMPWLGSAFEAEPEGREVVRARVFDYGELPTSVPGVVLKPEIRSALNLSDGMQILVGEKHRARMLTVEHNSKHASARFLVRHLDDEWAFVHTAGLRLALSESRQTADGRVHENHFELFRPKSKTPIKGDILPFLRLLQPGAKILFSSHDEKPMPLDHWGSALEKVGPAVSAAESLSTALEIAFDEFALADLREEEFGNTLGFLDTFLLDAIPLEATTPGFILGSNATGPVSEIPTEAVELRVPVVMNWKEIGIVLWVDCYGAGFMDGGKVCGIRIIRQHSWRVEKVTRFKKSAYPEMWIDKEWPAIRLNGMEPGVYEWPKIHGSTITLEARMR